MAALKHRRALRYLFSMLVFSASMPVHAQTIWQYGDNPSLLHKEPHSIIIPNAIQIADTSDLEFPIINNDPAGANFDESTNLDIIGIKLGNTMNEATQALSEFYKVAPQEIEERQDVSDGTGSHIHFKYVKLLQNDPLNAKIDNTSIVLSSPAYSSRIIGIFRKLDYGRNNIDTKMSARQMMSFVIDKYGLPTFGLLPIEGGRIVYYYLYVDGKLKSGPQNTKVIDTRKLPNGIDFDELFTLTDSKGTESFPLLSTQESAAVYTAKVPCGAFTGRAWLLRYDFADIDKYLPSYVNRFSTISDDHCTGIMTVTLKGTVGPVPEIDSITSAEFMLIDLKRAYGDQAALHNLLISGLSSGRFRPAVPKPKL